MKRILSIACSLIFGLLVFHAAATLPGEWKYHPSFDASVTRIIDTPERTYFMGNPQTVNPAIPFKATPSLSLFYLDKETDEIVSVAQRHAISSPAVKMVEYNREKGYLLIVSNDFDIDFLYDDDSLYHLPALKFADIPGSKNINDITFTPNKNLAVLATDFGYVALDDEAHEVAESRNYDLPLLTAARVGNYFIMADGQNTWMAPAHLPRFLLSDYSRPEALQGFEKMRPVDDVYFFITRKREKVEFKTVQISGGTLTPKREETYSTLYDIVPSKKGYLLINYSTYIDIGVPGMGATFMTRPSDEAGLTYGSSWDQKEFFSALPQKGLRSMNRAADGTYTAARGWMRPNAAPAFFSRSMAYHPSYGMLVNSHGADGTFSNNAVWEQNLLASLKDGLWTPLSAAYRNTTQKNVAFNPLGLAIDPDNSNLVYFGSNFSGFTRYNLADPNDILHYTHAGESTSRLPGFVDAGPSQSWARLFCFSAPVFDSNQVLWSAFADQDSPNTLEFRYWPAADRRASTTAENARPWKKIRTSGLSSDLKAVFAPLKSSVNRNLLFYLSSGGMMVYNHAGTPDNTSDDAKVVITDFTDQDGGTVSYFSPRCIFEDPESGIVWIGVESGMYYCQPLNLLQGQRVLNRVKVARNDGTQLADYLLNGVAVNHITADGAGRKWISTIGAGLVVTSADGKTVIQEFTEANSDIPSDNVYFACHNPQTNSMMVSTERGLCEFFIGGTGSNGSGADYGVRAYPNPVAPDYYGWVNIDGLADNSLVKIADAQGNIVRELGVAENGAIQWDVLNMGMKRVKTGVYYILSSDANGGGEANVAKILIMN